MCALSERGAQARLVAADWSESSIEQIERDHRALLCAYRNEPVFKKNIEECKLDRTSFSKGWAPANGRFHALRDFCGGLASVFPNTATVESDFSVIGWEKNVYRKALTDFSLEGIIQAKQFRRLQEL